MHNLKHNKVRTSATWCSRGTLAVPQRERRLEVRGIADGWYRVTLRFGFMETPDVPVAMMAACDVEGDFWIDPQETTYFTSRETVVAGVRHGMALWREKLFSTMHRNAAPASAYFRIPGDRLVGWGRRWRSEPRGGKGAGIPMLEA